MSILAVVMVLSCDLRPAAADSPGKLDIGFHGNGGKSLPPFRIRTASTVFWTSGGSLFQLFASGLSGGNVAVDGTVGAQPGMRAVLWHNATAIDLNSLIGPAWHLSVANDVNNRGEIVGSGFRLGDAIPHGFMLVPLTRLSSLTMSPAVVVGGKAVQATVTLTRAAPPGGETAFVTTSFAHSGAVAVPDAVTVAAGQSTVSFAISTSLVKRTTTGTVTATLDGKSISSALTVRSRS